MSAEKRLLTEKKNWRKNHPYGFSARPKRLGNGGSDLFVWNCTVPGREGTIWEGGDIPITLNFPKNYPQSPPKCVFEKEMHKLHPNVYGDGRICLDIVNPKSEHGTWKPSLTIPLILQGIQKFLTEPNPNSPASGYANENYKKNRKEYERLIRAYAKKKSM